MRHTLREQDVFKVGPPKPKIVKLLKMQLPDSSVSELVQLIRATWPSYQRPVSPIPAIASRRCNLCTHFPSLPAQERSSAGKHHDRTDGPNGCVRDPF